MKTVFNQKGLNPREGQPAQTTEASGSGGRKANEGKRCGALNSEAEHFSLLSCRKCFSSLSPSHQGELLHPLLRLWAVMVPWSLLEALSHRSGSTLAPGSSYPSEGVPSPSLLHHQAKYIPNSASCSLLLPKSFKKTGTEESGGKKEK